MGKLPGVEGVWGILGVGGHPSESRSVGSGWGGGFREELTLNRSFKDEKEALSF